MQASGKTNPSKTVFKDSVLYGEQEELADDCPQGHDDCFCDSKFALSTFGGNEAPGAIHPPKMSSFPYYKVKSYGVWDTSAELSGLIFNSFKARTKCGERQQILTVMEYASDYIPMHDFDNIIFNDVEP